MCAAAKVQICGSMYYANEKTHLWETMVDDTMQHSTRHAAAFHTYFPGLLVSVCSFNQVVAHCIKQASHIMPEILAVS